MYFDDTGFPSVYHGRLCPLPLPGGWLLVGRGSVTMCIIRFRCSGLFPDGKWHMLFLYVLIY